MDIKRVMISPVTFWMVFLIVPLYSLLQILFLETVFTHTNSFLGYSKYEGYVLMGTYRIVQAMGFFFFVGRLSELKNLLRGTDHETFDTVLTKPIDSQLYGTMGKYMLGNIGPFFIGILITVYGMIHLDYVPTAGGIISYIFLAFLGTLVMYFSLFILQMLLFWSPELQFTEAIWDNAQQFGKYPSALYQGGIGILVNLMFPITLMAAIPSEFLFGKIPAYMLLTYTGSIFVLFIITRLVWKFALQRYASFSS